MTVCVCVYVIALSSSSCPLMTKDSVKMFADRHRSLQLHVFEAAARPQWQEWQHEVTHFSHPFWKSCHWLQTWALHQQKELRCTRPRQRSSLSVGAFACVIQPLCGSLNVSLMFHSLSRWQNKKSKYACKLRGAHEEVFKLGADQNRRGWHCTHTV